MKKVIIALALLLGSIAPIGQAQAEADVAATDEMPFTDIAKHWAKDNILKAYESGLVDGFPDGTFRPDDVVTADQFLVMMLRAHSVTVDGKTEFDPEWYRELGAVQPGHLNTIKSTVSRQKFNFQSASAGYWAKPFIDFIFETPFIYTNDLVFPKDYNRFKKQIMREEASYLLGSWFTTFDFRLQIQYAEHILKNSGLKDFNNFGVDAGTYRADVLAAGLMNGYPTNNFYPKRYVTRAEALTMAQRLREPALRIPFKPSLKGLYYTENEGTVFLFSDKTKYDFYNKFVALASQHIKTGYIYKFGGSGLQIFKSEDDYEKWIYMTKTMQFENRPTAELIVQVDPDTYKTAGIVFPYDTTFPNTKNYLASVYDMLAGPGMGSGLKKQVDLLMADGISKSFTYNGKNFEYKNLGKLISVTLYY
ncbi:S-layer homology domain-containing protein [Paenibacillus soyae]|uniref:S-layer homology domain-containing protein n=1 Tax=Paenibacillus soyae TaxID=2969249 RepID=A0A9X2MUJ2_9BACL|nr:S-layer homology domain-containing protein [Paenibacillus soyae]MCR2806103.1 S-layer homology domain-containing protein [Paenibacillus soyae]